MNILRWIISFPAAMMVSFLAWGLATQIFASMYYGPAWHLKLTGLTPMILKTGIPAAAFVVTGVLLSPSKGRRIVFIFFALALLFSGGGMEALFNQADEVFWLSAFVGTILGSLVGLGIAFRIQGRRKRKEVSQGVKLPSVSE